MSFKQRSNSFERQHKTFNILHTIVFCFIGLVFIAVFGSIGYRAFESANNPKVQFGVNGLTESRCMDGYKFVLSGDGRVTQILDSFGKGIQCEK